MRFIRLKTAEGIHREIDFIDTAKYRRLPDTTYDADVRNVEGEQSVFARARRRNIQLQVDGMTAADLEELMQIQGDRQRVYIEANVGQHTAIYNPGERSRTPYIGSSAFARTSVGTYVADDGLIHEAASGLPRFEACKIGNGILLEQSSTNKAYPSHPANGALGWVSSVGSPVLSWDTSMASNVYGKTGVMKVTATTNDVIALSVTAGTPPLSACAFVWVKGCNRIEFSTTGATGTTTTGNVQLSMTWQRLALENLTTDNGICILKLTFPDAYSVCYVSAVQFETGRATYTSYIPTTTAAVTRSADQLYYLVSGLNPIEGSISCWMKYPRANPYIYIWYINAGWFGYIDSGGYLKMAINGGTTNFGAIPSCSAGDLVHVAWSWQEDYAVICINGVVLSTSSSMNRDRSTAMTLVAQYLSSTNEPNAVIDDFRVDTRYVDWTAEYLKFSDEANLALMKLTQARTFRISPPELQPKEANAQYFDGTIDLAEATSDSNHTLEVA